MGSKHHLVLSDLHLSDVEDHPDGWKAYKGSRFLFDDDLAELVARFEERHRGEGPLVLLLNGDIIDFDLTDVCPADPPWPVSRTERGHGLEDTEEKSAWKLGHILSFHPRFVELLAGFLARGNEVVYLLGNHDRAFCFPAVRRVLQAAVEARAAEAGPPPLPYPIRFEPWFYYVPGLLYAEHGHQFDYYTAFKNQLSPTVDDHGGPRLAHPMGNLSSRYLMTRIGTFSPHASDFILNFFRYIHHWVKHYLFSRRSLVFSWLWGSLLIVRELFRLKRKLLSVRGPHGAEIEEIARRFDVPTPTVKRLNQLHRRPITNRVYRILREFWLDRLLIALLMTGGTIALSLVAIPLWIKLMVPLSSFPLLYFVYEYLAQGENIFSVETRLPEYARTIAELLPVRVVTFGHTHHPRLIALSRGVAYVDTGTWAPITRRDDPTRLVPGLRTYLEVSLAGGDAAITLDSWMRPDPQGLAAGSSDPRAAARRG
jgi:UDP-2,3-diacylglucosamine pyrophosphatase LpxH